MGILPKVAIQGEEGSFSEEAGIKYWDKSVEFIPKRNSDEVIEAIEEKEVEKMPDENKKETQETQAAPAAVAVDEKRIRDQARAEEQTRIREIMALGEGHGFQSGVELVKTTALSPKRWTWQTHVNLKYNLLKGSSFVLASCSKSLINYFSCPA